jgi:DNA primase
MACPGFQNFRRRVLIPVYDLDGVLVSFQGRDITGSAEQKYLFPIGYAVTGSHLYNGHNVSGTTRIVVGEGAFDVAAIKVAFDADPALRDVVAVGTFGKHLSFGEPGSQLEKFRRLKDERGIDRGDARCGTARCARPTTRSTPRSCCAGIGFKVRIAMLPPEKDPNEVPCGRRASRVLRSDPLHRRCRARHQDAPSADERSRESCMTRQQPVTIIEP